MSIDKIKPEDYQEDITDQEWDKQIDAKASQRQIGGDHYKTLAIQPAEYCFRNNLNNLEADAVTYITRNRLKNGSEDIKKAIHSLELLLQYSNDNI